MGSGHWSTDIHHADAVYRARTGRPAFGYTSDMRARGHTSWTAHPALDPRGVTVRESRDSEALPRLSYSPFESVTCDDAVPIHKHRQPIPRQTRAIFLISRRWGNVNVGGRPPAYFGANKSKPSSLKLWITSRTRSS